MFPQKLLDPLKQVRYPKGTGLGDDGTTAAIRLVARQDDPGLDLAHGLYGDDPSTIEKAHEGISANDHEGSTEL